MRIIDIVLLLVLFKELYSQHYINSKQKLRYALSATDSTLSKGTACHHQVEIWHRYHTIGRFGTPSTAFRYVGISQKASNGRKMGIPDISSSMRCVPMISAHLCSLLTKINFLSLLPDGPLRALRSNLLRSNLRVLRSSWGDTYPV